MDGNDHDHDSLTRSRLGLVGINFERLAYHLLIPLALINRRIKRIMIIHACTYMYIYKRLINQCDFGRPGDERACQ